MTYLRNTCEVVRHYQLADMLEKAQDDRPNGAASIVDITPDGDAVVRPITCCARTGVGSSERPRDDDD